MADLDDEWRDISFSLGEMGDCVDPEVTERILLHDRKELRRLWDEHAYHKIQLSTVREIEGDDVKIARFMAKMLNGRPADDFTRAWHELGCRVIPRMLGRAAIGTEPVGEAVESPRDPPWHIQVLWPDGEGPEDPSVPPMDGYRQERMRHDVPMMDDYKHLNDRERDGVVLDIESVAEQVVHLNYGVHRLLSAIVRRRLEKSRSEGREDELAVALKALLDGGLY